MTPVSVVALMDAIIEEHGAVVPQTIALSHNGVATRINAFEKYSGADIKAGG